MNKTTYSNPILPGFYPDPSICRVDDDYYLITSSFTFFPGVPIFHSKDLVNWSQIGHVLDRISQLNLDGAAYTAGIFAPTLRYHAGKFYMITTNVGNGGNFIVTAEDPKGPWSDPYWLDDAPGIDPSLFFDEDGRAYYTGTGPKKDPQYFGDQEIWVQELDLNTMQLVGEKKGIWDGALKRAYFCESPHMYKVDGWYYLMIAESGTEHYHSVTIARSKDIWGPYEANPGNPILTHRHLGKAYAITNPGHGDLVCTAQGEWYMVVLGSRPYGGYKNLCRETFMMPVVWEDGWPIVSPGTGRVEFSYPLPKGAVATADTSVAGSNWTGRDDFDQPKLDMKWNFLRTPRDPFWSLETRPGYLRLRLREKKLVDLLKMPSWDVAEGPHSRNREPVVDHPAFIGRRQQHMNFTVKACMQFMPNEEGEAAGLALIQNDNHQIRLEVIREDGQNVIRVLKHRSKVDFDFMAKTFSYENKEQVLGVVNPTSDRLILTVRAEGQRYSFFIGYDADEEIPVAMNVDGSLLSPEIAGGCSGTYIGMFATGNGKASSNHADFDWFDYSGSDC